MNKNLKTTLENRSSEKGFAIPIAVGMGLIMLLVGTTMIVRSQVDQVTASAQRATSRGLSAAETGITYYQSLINNNRAIATYKDCVGTRNASGTCSDTGTTASWANATTIPGIAGIGSSCSGSGSASNVTAASTTTSWRDINSNSSLGQHRLISYVYPAPGTTGTVGTAPGIGQLTVEGRVNQSGSGAAATTDIGTATARLQINIPVQEGNYPNVPFPGMWVNNSLNTGNTQANILYPCGVTARATVASGYTLKPTISTMPNSPSKPTTNIKTISNPANLTLPLAADIAIHNADIVSNITNNSLSNFNWATGEYQYSVPQINTNLTLSPGYKVAIYLDGNIDMTGGQKAILHQCGTTPNCSPTDARIYGLSATGTLSLGGNACISDIFFFSPTYAVNLSGGGQAQGCSGGATNNGIYWVKSWDGGGQGNHVSLYQTSADWSNMSFLIPVPPQLASITSWQRQEASP